MIKRTQADWKKFFVVIGPLQIWWKVKYLNLKVIHLDEKLICKIFQKSSHVYLIIFWHTDVLLDRIKKIMLARIHTILVVLQHKTDGKHQRAEILLTNKIYIYTFITSACNKYEVLYLVKTTHMQVHVRSKTLYPFYSHLFAITSFSEHERLCSSFVC